jgi:CubicO group peptidase (beta-lactamase class C family)
MTNANPAAMPSRLERIAALCQAWTTEDPQRTVALHVSRHGGATGTLAWADPDSGLAYVVLTNDPQSGSFRARVSNLVAGLS